MFLRSPACAGLLLLLLLELSLGEHTWFPLPLDTCCYHVRPGCCCSFCSPHCCPHCCCSTATTVLLLSSQPWPRLPRILCRSTSVHTSRATCIIAGAPSLPAHTGVAVTQKQQAPYRLAAAASLARRACLAVHNTRRHLTPGGIQA